ncbi:FAD-dependent oxidoreductase [Variovorax sp. LT1R16]|uniref:FAD-dependent oxidoreductase n=1 Tax=Variovorax sp. LT1R16 TaxID=3443728 RepID=UPI003F472B04
MASAIDVVVVGAGPVGLATALGVATAGGRVLILEKALELNTSPRAMAYPFPSLEALERLGVLDAITEKAYIGNGCGFINFRTGEQFSQSLEVLKGHVPHPYGLQLGQGDVSSILVEALSREGVEVQWGCPITSISQDEAAATVVYAGADGKPISVRAAYVVGADGASSAVRDLAGFQFPGMTWPDRFVSTNIRYDFAAHGLPSAAWRIDSEYGAVIARIDKSDLWRYTFRESEQLPLEGLEERIHKHFERGLYGGSYELVQFAPYRMHQRCVENFRRGRVLLAGDAAHVTNPVGGMGLSGGFMDAYVLADALSAVLKGRANEVVLDFYAARRKEIFTGIVSPVATTLKGMLFDPPEGDARDAMFAHLRALSHDEDLLREDLLKQRALFTASVVQPKGGE